MKYLPWALVVIVTALWVWTFIPIVPPIVDLGNGSVSPAKVKRLGTVTVTRNLRAHRADDVIVTRTMVRGDCSKNCEIIDLPGGRLSLQPGDYLNLTRDHVIPVSAQDGSWRLVFSIVWRDKLGRTRIEFLPELTVEVEG